MKNILLSVLKVLFFPIFCGLEKRESMLMLFFAISSFVMILCCIMKNYLFDAIILDMVLYFFIAVFTFTVIGFFIIMVKEALNEIY